MSQYFPKPYEPFEGDIKMSSLAGLKTEVEKLDIDKLTPVPDDLAKLSNIVKNDVVKKN